VDVIHIGSPAEADQILRPLRDLAPVRDPSAPSPPRP